MDFFRGVFNSQPVMALISCKTSSAMARNSGLFFAEGAGDGRVPAGQLRAAEDEGAQFADLDHLAAYARAGGHLVLGPRSGTTSPIPVG